MTAWAARPRCRQSETRRERIEDIYSKNRLIIFAIAVCCALLLGATAASAQDADQSQDTDLRRQLEDLKEQVEELEAALAAQEEKTEKAAEVAQDAADEAKAAAEGAEEEEAEAEDEDVIHVGGAVRTQYSYEDYDDDNSDRVGDFDLDTIRFNFDGEIGDVILSAEYRFYQYMNVVHHAWAGYDFNDTWHGRLGIFQVPFGVLPYNSHSYFFDTTYYVGLEDDYDTGFLVRRRSDDWDLDLAFLKNDEMGGLDGFVDNRSDRYSYDIVGERVAGEGTFDSPSVGIAERDTFNGRLAYKFGSGDFSGEVGGSGYVGDLEGSTGSVGDQTGNAIHFVGDYGRWNLQVQRAEYEYDLDSGRELLAVGAYSFFDTIPSEATIYTANLAYSVPVDWGPVTNLTFYNDYSLMTDKSGGLQDDTKMNVLGVAVSAGGLYTYIDYVTGENQPFIGGSLGQDGGDTNHRLNLNFGYYF